MRGFTLVELLVVIAIMGSLVGLILPQFNSFNQDQSLKNAVAELQSAIRITQNNAGSGVKCSTTLPSTSWYLGFGNSDPSLIGKSYQIVANCADNTTSTPITYKLPGGVSIASITVNDSNPNYTCITALNAASAGNFKITFSNLSGAVDLQSDAGCPTLGKRSMTITLQQDSDHTNHLDVVIEKGGSIYVQ